LKAFAMVLWKGTAALPVGGVDAANIPAWRAAGVGGRGGWLRHRQRALSARRHAATGHKQGITVAGCDDLRHRTPPVV
jgi:2-keto-3-deoxy-6-phosphogluconate aldolase